MNENWISNLAVKAIRIYKFAVGNHRQDITRPIIEDFIDDGYQIVQWNSNGSRHSVCRDLNRQQWNIEDFISGLSHDAPMFEKSHPGCSSCSITLSGNGLPAIELDSFGDTDAAIGSSRPLKVPVAPKTKVLAPKPQVQVVEKPKPPTKPKVRYIPEEVHKQIDPFKKQEVVDEITEEDKEDWIKNIDKENVEPDIYPKKELTDEEWDELRNFNVETSQRVPQWIKGIFK